jgi:hypothetical protein
MYLSIPATLIPATLKAGVLKAVAGKKSDREKVGPQKN